MIPGGWSAEAGSGRGVLENEGEPDSGLQQPTGDNPYGLPPPSLPAKDPYGGGSLGWVAAGRGMGFGYRTVCVPEMTSRNDIRIGVEGPACFETKR